MLGLALLFSPKAARVVGVGKGLWIESLCARGSHVSKVAAYPPPLSQYCGGDPGSPLTVCGIELWNYIS